MASEFIALSLMVGICKKFDIYYSGYIQTHCQKNKKIKRADQILPEVYGTTLSTNLHYVTLNYNVPLTFTVHNILIKPAFSNHLPHVTLSHCSLGRSHKTGLTVINRL